jgi:hypothetical protein
MKSIPMIFLQVVVTFLPWRWKRFCLERFWGYRIHPSARIGFSWIYPQYLVMEEGAKIGHFNVAIHLDRMLMGCHSSIARANWITGFPRGSSKHFAHQTERDPSLLLGPHAAVTKNHHLDCTNRIEIGPFSTVAGYASQFLTHSIDVQECRQDSAPIVIGKYCFVGTNVVILGGAVLPDRSVLGAKALLNKSYLQTGQLYAGVPAKPCGSMTGKLKYFGRDTGFVN